MVRLAYDTSLHLPGRCSALVGKLRKQFGKHFKNQSTFSEVMGN